MHAGFHRRLLPALSWRAFGAALLSSIVLAGPATAHNPRAHVHGDAELEVVADGARLEIALEAPLDSVLGFEHAPRTDRQREAVRAMAARLRQGQALFTPTPDAGCAFVSVRLASSAIAPELLGEAATAGAAAKADEHADLDAGYVFRCSAPERLRGVDVVLQKAFPGIRTLKVRVVGPRGQKAVTLTRGRTAVAW